MTDTARPAASGAQVCDGHTFGASAVFQHPLAYLIGLEGVALLRAFGGDYGRDFIDARLEETKALLNGAGQLGEAMMVEPFTVTEGYDIWSTDYDEPGNGLLGLDGPIVRRILDDIPAGIAVDAACGTGRHTEHLKALGHDVIGVDASPGMLAKARERLPDADLRLGDLRELPVPDNHADVVVCALALTHLPALGPAIAEFARVLRPGGHLVISDVHSFMINAQGFPLIKPGPDGTPGYIPQWSHRTSDYLVAALPVGFQVRSCFEPRFGELVDPTSPPEPLPAGAVADPWLLHGWAPEATNAAYRGLPIAIFWRFQLDH
ncbi:class I SAM-dependent methyltransferase [Jiangella asiatica]|uniref:Class I SAM-dependent methyltransferase n=1 Tax=Jiangella asiatica TaxID=2530372 RepID=A0A4V2Z3K6_9ACTN|nr:class I SAM-dependent methyltransferase [Jiangella asiatica]TDE13088.1 class I SAM-dependent methyltransferase [Jiangella asiatica]